MNHTAFRLLWWFFCAVFLPLVLDVDGFGNSPSPGRQSTLS